MAFWSDASGYEPKRAYRWILYINGEDLDNIEDLTIPAYTIKKVSKPSFQVTESSHQFLNHTYYYPGRVEWSTISFTLVDPVSPDAAEKLNKMISNAGYVPGGSPDDFETMSKSKSMKALGKVRISQLDADGIEVEEWTLHNAWIKDVKFGELDYSSDDMVETEVELRFDYATHSSE